MAPKTRWWLLMFQKFCTFGKQLSVHYQDFSYSFFSATYFRTVIFGSSSTTWEAKKLNSVACFSELWFFAKGVYHEFSGISSETFWSIGKGIKEILDICVFEKLRFSRNVGSITKIFGMVVSREFPSRRKSISKIFGMCKGGQIFFIGFVLLRQKYLWETICYSKNSSFPILTLNQRGITNLLRQLSLSTDKLRKGTLFHPAKFALAKKTFLALPRKPFVNYNCIDLKKPHTRKM